MDMTNDKEPNTAAKPAILSCTLNDVPLLIASMAEVANSEVRKKAPVRQGAHASIWMSILMFFYSGLSVITQIRIGECHVSIINHLFYA